MGALYKIGSFNVHNLSWGVRRDLDRIVNIIKRNELDIVALQEVLSEGKRIDGSGSVSQEALKRTLMYRLGADWDCVIRRPNNHLTSKYPYPYLGNDSREEGYAFLWNKKRIELPEVDRKAVYPEIWSNYHLREENLFRLIRDPLVGRFKIKGRPVEIRLITTHIIFGKPAESNLAMPVDLGALSLRRNEFKVLAGEIYAAVCDDHRDIEGIVSYTIILGDYNLNLPESGLKRDLLTEGNFETGIICFDKNGLSTTDPAKSDRSVFTVQHDLTTLQINRDGHAKGGYASNYDHFSFDEEVKSVFKDCYAIDAVHGSTKKMSPASYITCAQPLSGLDSPFEIYLKDVSDHLPIVMELDF